MNQNYNYICGGTLLYIVVYQLNIGLMAPEAINKDIEFKLLFDELFQALNGFIMSFVKEEETARDLTQEAFLRVYQKWDLFECPDTTKAFLYVTAKNLCLDHFRKTRTILKHRKQIKPADFAENQYLLEVTRQETLRLLRKYIEELPCQAREVLIQTLQGRSNIEIAEELGISVNTVKTHKKTGYKILREKLADNYLLFLLPLLLQ